MAYGGCPSCILKAILKAVAYNNIGFFEPKPKFSSVATIHAAPWENRNTELLGHLCHV